MDQWLLPAWLDAAVARRLEALDADRYAERLWEADATLWKPEDEAHQKIIGNALGWLSVFEGVREQIEGVTEFVDELRAEGYRSAVLLGMGGSSLAPEVMREVLGVREGYLDLHVLDSTDPAAVLAVEAAVDLETTLFVVSSKSGGTTETASFHAYFYERLQETGRRPRRPPLRGDHRRGHVAPAGGARPGLPRRVRQPVGHRRPLLGAQLLRHGARGAHRRRPRAAARRRPRRRPSRAARTSRPARTPPCGSAPCWARPRWPAATS